MAKHSIVDKLNEKWGTKENTIVGAINAHFNVKGKNIADALDKGLESSSANSESDSEEADQNGKIQ